MVLGFHNVPLLAGILTLLLTIILVSASVALRRKEPEFAGIASGVLGLLIVVVSIGGGAYTWIQESSLDTRDRAIETRLAPTGIQIAPSDYQVWSWDERIAVRKNGCTASYLIQTAVDLVSNPRTWPLVPGTGKSVIGQCDPDLDALFIH